MVLKDEKNLWWWYALAASLLLLALRIWLLSLDRYALYGDEAQYWTWAKTLDWGYYSKPPMVAWMIALSTYFAGDSAFAIRLSSPILHFFTALVLFAIGRRLYNDKVAFWASITYATMPAVTLSSTLASTDPSLLFFWAVALYGLLRAEADNRIRWWLLVGLACGLGGLSKYNMLFFGASVLLYFFLKKKLHRVVQNPRAWLGVCVALLVYMPNFYWNMEHGFVSYLHTGDNAQGQGFSLKPLQLLEFFGAQFAVFGPILFATLVWVMVKKRTRLHAFITPMLLAILVISLISRAHANWAAPIYVAATLMVVAYLLKTKREKWLVASLCLHIGLAAAFFSFEPLTKALGFELTKKTDPFRRLKGQHELAIQTRELLEKFPNAKILSEERRVVATLMYYLRTGNKPAKIYKWNPKGIVQDHYDIITDMNEAKGADFIMIARTDDPRKFFPYFQANGRLRPISIPLYKDYTLSYRVYLLEGFKGY